MDKYGMPLVGLLLFCMMGVGFAQTCNENVQATTPDSRFEVSGDEVTDVQTGLIWQRCSIGQSWDGSSCLGAATRYNWSQALAQASGDWRLPNIKELSSIVETACVTPAINLSVFPNTMLSRYWSSSSNAYASSEAWNVYFPNGFDGRHAKDNDYFVRLVRGGQ